MASWLVKTEPGEYSWADLVRDRRTHWDGVTNPQAQLNMRTMAKGDTVVVYHSQTDKAAVGLAKVVKTGYPDPTDANGRRVWVDIAPVRATGPRGHARGDEGRADIRDQSARPPVEALGRAADRRPARDDRPARDTALDPRRTT